MDPAAISQRVKSEKKWCVDGKAQQHPPSSLEVVSKVLDDENLLIEILLRVGFPTTLVHAALVCRRWLHHASKPAFLSSSRKLHPPHLLGFYVDVSVPLQEIPPRFVQILPQPPELAVVVRHLDTYEKEDRNIHDLDEWSGPELINGFWNGKFTNRGMVGVPPLSPHNELKSGQCSLFRDLLSKEKGHGLLYVWSSINADHNKGRGKLTMNLYKFENGFWHMHTSVTPELTYRKVDEEPLLVKTKVYMRRFIEGDILVWDFMASSFFTIQLPGVEYLDRNTMLSLADDTEFYLLHLNNVQLRIWLYSGDNWLLMDTICLSQFYAILGVSDATAADEYNAIIRIGDGGNKVEYVFLRIGQCALHLDIKHRVLRKVYELTEAGGFLWDIHPLMMIWPPAFPSLKDDTSRMPCEEQGYEKALG